MFERWAFCLAKRRFGMQNRHPKSRSDSRLTEKRENPGVVGRSHRGELNPMFERWLLCPAKPCFGKGNPAPQIDAGFSADREPRESIPLYMADPACGCTNGSQVGRRFAPLGPASHGYVCQISCVPKIVLGAMIALRREPLAAGRRRFQLCEHSDPPKPRSCERLIAISTIFRTQPIYIAPRQFWCGSQMRRTDEAGLQNDWRAMSPQL